MKTKSIEKSTEINQRLVARQQISEALETFFGHPAKGMPEEKDYSFVFSHESHKKLTMKTINDGIVAFMILTGISSGSCSDFNLYRLLNNYLLLPEKRAEINRLLVEDYPRS